MYLPPVRPVSYSNIYVSGDVTIDESAVIAPGTILNAAPNSRIVIRAGVCVGMGTVLNASGGAIEIEEGAVIGAGVLAIGNVQIGDRACIGTATTIFNACVEKMAVIPSGSLIGDMSRQVAMAVEDRANNAKHSVADNNGFTPESETDREQALQDSSLAENNGYTPESETDREQALQDSSIESEEVKNENSSEEPSVEVAPHQTESEPSAQNSKSPVVGQVYINQLLVTLFPERDFLNRLKQNSE
jgi:carbon dioxide concentrating mechanism protein CcmN